MTHRRAAITARHVAAVGLVLTTLLALALAAPPAVGADHEPPTFVQTIGGPGHAGVYAWGAATLPHGNVVIGDYWNYRMHEYTVEGELVRTFGSRGDGTGQNNAPHGIAVDPINGDIYVSDLNNGDIDKFTVDGTPIRDYPSWAVFPGTSSLVTVPIPYAPRLATDTRGWTFMVNSHTFPSPEEFVHRIIIRDQAWRYQSYIGEHGDFGVLRGITVTSDDLIYLVDAGQSRIHVLNFDGSEAQPSFGSKGSGPGQFLGDMRGIAVDEGNGWVYVVDTAANQIEKFDLDGNPILRWGTKGTGPGQFGDGGREITLAPDPRPGMEDAPPLVVAPDFANTRVNVYDAGGAFLWDFPNPPGLPPEGGFNQPQDVAVSPDDGSVYVVDTFNHRLQQFDPETGEFVRAWGFRGRNDPNAMNYPRGAAVDPANGDVWLMNTREGDVKVYTAEGVHKFTFGEWGQGPGELNYARGIFVGANRVYIADSNNRRLQIRSKTGTLLQTIPCAPESTGLVIAGCTDVVEAPDGTFYAAAVDEHVVYHYAANGTLLDSFGGKGSRRGDLRGPYGLAIHNDRLYVSEAYNHRISVFTLSGEFVDLFGSRGDGDGQFEQPKGISVADNGRLYVSDHFNERIQVFQLEEPDSEPPPLPDDEAPVIAVAQPSGQDAVVQENPVVISGTATDNVGVASVQVAVQDRQSGQWWRGGTSWGTYQLHFAGLAAAGAESTEWSITFSAPGDGDFGIATRAVDAAGNIGKGTWIRFSVSADTPGDEPDNDAPAGTFSEPANNATVDAPVTITGSATDDQGVGSVRLGIQDRTTKLWARSDGSWGAFQLHDATLAIPGAQTTGWSFTWSGPPGDYGATLRTTDTAGNVDPTNPFRRFTIR